MTRGGARGLTQSTNRASLRGVLAWTLFSAGNARRGASYDRREIKYVSKELRSSVKKFLHAHCKSPLALPCASSKYARHTSMPRGHTCTRLVASVRTAHDRHRQRRDRPSHPRWRKLGAGLITPDPRPCRRRRRSPGLSNARPLNSGPRRYAGTLSSLIP